MELNETDTQSFRFLTRQQRRIYQRLILVGEGPAAFYRDACRIMVAEPPFETITHLMGHCLREIESALRDVLKPAVANLNSLKKKSATAEERYRDDIYTILQGLEIPETDEIAQLWLRLPGSQSPFGLHRYAHRDNLTRPRPFDQDFQAFWGEMEMVFDRMLEKFEAHYLSTHRLIDDLLARDTPTVANIEILKKAIPSNRVSLGYFFEKLSTSENINWLQPLRTEGFFKYPPDPEYDLENKQVSLSPWPASRYLSRIAVLVPQQALEIALEIPDTEEVEGIENIHVYGDLLDIAINIPSQMSVQLLPRVLRWVTLTYQGLLAEKYIAFMCHLVDGDQIDAAIELAEALLTQLFRIQSSFELWHFRELLKTSLPALVVVAGMRALRLFCDSLAVGIQPVDEQDTSALNSSTWRPAIEEHHQNVPQEFESARDLLISFIRDAAEQIVREKIGSLKEVIEQLEQQDGSIFHRCTLYLLSVFPQDAPELVTRYLTDRQQFDNVDIRHEYTLLAQVGFAFLSSNDQAKILAWVEQGPLDVEEVKAFYERQTGKPPTEELIMGYIKSWQRDWLARLGPDLPPEWKDTYQRLVTEIGPALHPEFEMYVSEVRWERTSSPKSAEDLSAMPVKELVSFLKNWQPSPSQGIEDISPTPEGLRNQLVIAVETMPQRFAGQAGLFRGLDPFYVHAILTGLERAASHQKVFPWRSVITLCDWVIHQRRKPSRRKGAHPHHDPQWLEPTKTALSLLSLGLKQTLVEIPMGFRARLWNVLQPLTEDPNPTREDEQPFSGSPKELVGFSLNTIRGMALHAVIQYALWAQRNVQGNEREPGGFDTLAQVQEVLDHHLNLVYDPSLAIRSIYGRWFPWLVLLDQQWTQRNIPRIFPPGESYRDWRNVAWETYVIYCPPNVDALHLLFSEYQQAIGHIGESSTHARPHPYNPDEHLAEHLMTFYWWGTLDVDEPEGLFVQFFMHASKPLRRYSFEYVGRSLFTAKESISLEVLARLQRLWEWFIERVSKPGMQETIIPELAAFGWWFSSGKFNDSWALMQLEKVLEFNEKIDMPDKVVERLAQLSAKMPQQTVTCLSLLMQAERDIWVTAEWKKHVRTLLIHALQSANREAYREARRVINVLASREIADFRDLLEIHSP